MIQRSRFLVAGDVAAFALGGLGAVAVSSRLELAQLPWLLAAAPAWLAVVRLVDARATLVGDAHGRRFAGSLLGALLACAIVAGRSAGPWDVLALGGLAWLASATLRALVRRLTGPVRVLLVGDGRRLEQLAQRLPAASGGRVVPVGSVRLTAAGALDAVPPLGRPGDASAGELARRHRVDHVVIEDAGDLDPAAAGLVHDFRELRLPVSVLSPRADALVPRAVPEQIAGITLLTDAAPRPVDRAKRAVDVLGAATLLLVGAPLLALVAAAIRLSSGSPVVYSQMRMGLRGKPFRLLKFRTMVNGAEAQQEALMSESRTAGWLDLEHDPRVTPVGRRLREWSLDELPQLLNVLRGDMSLVGPRPVIPSEYERIAPEWRRRDACCPGVTGAWQVAGRTTIPFEEMVELDCRYAAGRTLRWDLEILASSPQAILSRRGVN